MNELPDDLQTLINESREVYIQAQMTASEILIIKCLIAIAIRLEHLASYVGLLEAVKMSELSDDYGRMDEEP